MGKAKRELIEQLEKLRIYLKKNDVDSVKGEVNSDK